MYYKSRENVAVGSRYAILLVLHRGIDVRNFCNAISNELFITLLSVEGIHGSEGLGEANRPFGLLLSQLAISIFSAQSSSLYSYCRNK